MQTTNVYLVVSLVYSPKSLDLNYLIKFNNINIFSVNFSTVIKV